MHERAQRLNEAEVEQLRARGAVWDERDLVAEQLDDLADARVAARRDPAALAAARRQLGDGDPSWLYYPWSGQLVRIVGPALFRELRLDRNRDKITADEQRTLAGARIGIVGLSVGNAVAATLAQEGIGGELVLADFDRLGTSNLNRVRASVTSVGLPKTTVAARQIAEIDPYVAVRTFAEGLTPANLDAFFDGLDLIVDECDGLAMKVLLRLEARRRRIPVLMETSDRGTLDVERFDLEPDLPLLGGRLEGLDPHAIAGLDAGERLAIVARAVGYDLSTRAAASMLEIGATLSTWPQLASDVALGGATVCAAAREVLLGRPLRSGRRRVDLAARLAEVEPAEAPSTAAPATGIAIRGVSERMAWLVEGATLAPSGGNCQPWRFVVRGDAVTIHHLRERSRSLLDVDGFAGLVSVGAAIEGLGLRASAIGARAEVVYTGAADGEVAVVHIGGSAEPDPLASYLGRRFTDRRSPPRRPLPDADRDALTAAIAPAGRLHLTTDPAALDALGAAIGAVDRVRFLHPGLGPEMWAEVRWSDADARARPDGISLAEMHVGPGDVPILRLLSRPDVAADLAARGRGGRLADLARDWVRSASAVGILSAASTSPADLLRAGRAAHRMWLQAVALGWSIQPIGVAAYMIRHLGTALEASYDPAGLAALRDADRTLHTCFPDLAPDHRLLLFRVLAGGERYAPQVRRPLSDVLCADAPGEPTG